MAAAAVPTHQQSRVEPQESCRVKSLDAACSIFVSQTLVIGHDGCYLEEEVDEEKLIHLVKDHEAIYDASRWEHVDDDIHNNKNNSTTDNSNNVLIVIRPSI